MMGESDYRKAVWNQYQHAHGFITPVEIFKPHYAISIANHIVGVLEATFSGTYLSKFSADNPLFIVEIGGGNGNCMKGVLDYLRDNYKNLYDVIKCISIDVSPQFVQLQKTTLQDHAEKMKFVNKSIYEIQEGVDLPAINNYTFVIGLEVLDNLPHDKLVLSNDSKILQVDVKQVDSKSETGNHFVEEHSPISDPVISEFLEVVSDIVGVEKDCFLSLPNMKQDSPEKFEKQKQLFLLWDYLILSNKSNFQKLIHSYISSFKHMLVPLFGSTSELIIYIPTGSFLFLKSLKRFFPNHYLILSDFHSIHGGIFGVNGPLVQRIEGNTVFEKKTYLDAPLGTYDIFFPTSFVLLSRIYQHVMNNESNNEILSTKSFMKRYAFRHHTRTRLGYNPLLEDFSNTSFFIANNLKKIE